MKPYVSPGVPVPDVRTDACLNQRHNGLGCTRCLASCPTGAIDLAGAGPNLDPSGCVSCGACAQVCPVGAISPGHGRPELVLTANLRGTTGTPIGILCVQSEDRGRTDLPVATVGLHRRCLAGIDLSILLSLLKSCDDDIWLDDSQCEDCAIGSVHPVIAGAAASANVLMRSLSSDKRVRMATQSEKTVAWESGKQFVETARFKVSRRGVFELLRSRADSLASKPVEPARIVREVSERGIPPQRSNLLAQLANWRQPVVDACSSSLPYAAVMIDGESCSACGLCARFCPTSALRFNVGDGSFTIGFEGSRCVDCALCAVACPEDAIEFGPTIAAAELVAGPDRLVAQGEVADCQDCGAVTTRSAESLPLCSSCRQGHGMIKPLSDGRGLMTDILGLEPSS